MLTKEGNFAGAKPIARHVIDVEVLQIVRTHFRFGALRRHALIICLMGHELGEISVSRMDASTALVESSN